MGRLIAGLIVIGLAIGVWLLWPRSEEPAQVATTTTIVEAVVTTTTVPASTTTTAESHVVTTVEEAEAILRELWFGWFEGIYDQDEERIKEVVATQALLDAARNQFGVMEFVNEPTLDSVGLSGVEILRSDENCLAVWSRADFTTVLGEGVVEGVDVLRRVENEWRMAGAWVHRDDLWEPDCESQLEPVL